MSDSIVSGLGTYVDHFPPPVTQWEGPLKPDVREGAKDPVSPKPPRFAVLPVSPPQWEAPDFDARPFEAAGEDCVQFYETPTYTFSFKVPETSLVAIKALSYQWHITRPIGDVFRVELLRNHDTLTGWEDIVISAAGDLGARFAFCSHVSPLPIFARFDRNDVIGIRVTYRGPYPFGIAPNVGIPGRPRFRTVFNGWLSTITNNRDGQSKNTRVRTDDLPPMIDHAMGLLRERRWRF